MSENEKDLEQDELEEEEESSQEEEESDSEESSEEESENDDSDDELSAWKERALKAEKAIEQNKKKSKKTRKRSNIDNNKAEPEDELAQRLQRLEQSDEKRTFGYENNLSPEETDRVFAYANGNNMEPSEALKDPFIKSGLKALRREKRAGDNAPSSSSSSPTFKVKQDLSQQEKQKEFEKFMAKRTGSK